MRLRWWIPAFVILGASGATSDGAPPPKRTVQIIGRSTPAVDGKRWRAILTRRILSKDADEGESDELRLTLSDSHGVRRTIPIDGSANVAGEPWKPFLSTLHLMGRDLLLLRLPSVLTENVMTLRLLNIGSEGMVQPVFEATVVLDWSRPPCHFNERADVISDAADGSRIVVRLEQLDDEETCTKKQRLLRFQWRNGCYARVPEDAINSQLNDPWEQICIPGTGRVNEKAPPGAPSR